MVTSASEKTNLLKELCGILKKTKELVKRMKRCYYVISDIHGCFEKFKTLLKSWDRDNEILVILGDMVDRGPDSKGVIQEIMYLQKQYEVIVVGGNHEDLFLDWVNNQTETSFYYRIGGNKTIDSFFDEPVTQYYTAESIAKRLQKEYKEEIEFLRTLPSYYETEQYIFVHAGVNLQYADWKYSSENEFKNSGKRFLRERNETGKIIVFGHTKTRDIHPDGKDNVWISPCETKIGIDGGCVSGGKLHGVRLTSEGISEIISV